MTNHDEDDGGLVKAMEGLGMGKAIAKYILSIDEEEQVPRIVAMLHGVVQLMLIHIYAHYDRAALRNETGKITEAFRACLGNDDVPERKQMVGAIADGFIEAALNAKDSVTKNTPMTLEKFEPHVMCSVPKLARCVTSPMLKLLPAETVKQISEDNIPDTAMNAVVAGMKMAYIAPMSEEVENTFRFHARQVLIDRAKHLHQSTSRES